MMHRWIDPFTVIRSMRANTYSLRRDANGRMTYVHVIWMKPYVITQASQEEATHHDVSNKDESENPSIIASQQDEPEPPSNTSNQDAICNGNTSHVAPTTTKQSHHQAQSTYLGFLKGGVVGSHGNHRAKPLT